MFNIYCILGKQNYHLNSLKATEVEGAISKGKIGCRKEPSSTNNENVMNLKKFPY